MKPTEIKVGKTAKFLCGYSVVEVRVMALAEGYAMVRRKCCLPFVVSVKELTK